MNYLYGTYMYGNLFRFVYGHPSLGLGQKNPNQSVFFFWLFEVCFEVCLFLVE